MYSVLIVDDEPGTIQSFSMILNDSYNIFTATSSLEALEILSNTNIALVVLDLLMPEISGIELMQRMKEESIDAAVLIVTGIQDISTAIKGIHLGASNFIMKPPNVTEMRLLAARAIEERELLRDVIHLRAVLKEQNSEFDEVVGKSQAMCSVIELVNKAAAIDSNTLLTGESGTGKEIIARAIHSRSSRSNEPFIAVSCPNLHTELIDSELFGHEKGAFTGADEKRRGKFEIAADGTIFLDEITEMPLTLQAKLLRVIQEKEFQRVGGTAVVKTEARIISASNRNLTNAIGNGAFREDLYYRLNVIPISLPPLRDRKEDIPLLVDRFIAVLKKSINCKAIRFSYEAIDALIDYNWPGNVRELRNIIERALSLNGHLEIITEDCLLSAITNIPVYDPASDLDSTAVKTFGESVFEFEKELISQAILKADGNIASAAKLLNITERRLRYKLDKL